MTNTTIFPMTSLIVLAAFSVIGLAYAEEMGVNHPSDVFLQSTAIPDWVKNNFEWYVNDQIDEKTLLTSMNWMFDNNLMHLSDKAAQEVNDLRAENAKLRSEFKLIEGTVLAGAVDSPVDEHGRVMVQFHWDEETEQEALHHLRKAYDLNPALQTKVVQFDKDHDKWIDVLGIDWGSSSSNEDCLAADGESNENSNCWIRVSQDYAGDPDRPIITGVVPNAETTDDRPTEEVAFYYNKITSASETIHDLVSNGETSTTGWEKGIAAFTSKNFDSSSTPTESVIPELGSIVVLCNTAIEKEIQTIKGEIAILEELMDMYTSSSTSSARASTQYSESDFQFISRYTSQIDTKIQSLQTGLGVLEDMMSSARNDRQLTSTQFENAMQKNQDTLESLKEKITQIDENGEFWFTDLTPGY
jgi:hypothetical protein